jgi:hypothetical protein
MTQNIRAGGAWHLVYVLDPFPPPFIFPENYVIKNLTYHFVALSYEPR